MKELIENPGYDPRHILQLQLSRLNERIRLETELRNRLEDLMDLLGGRQNVSGDYIHKALANG